MNFCLLEFLQNVISYLGPWKWCESIPQDPLDPLNLRLTFQRNYFLWEYGIGFFLLNPEKLCLDDRETDQHEVFETWRFERAISFVYWWSCDFLYKVQNILLTHIDYKNGYVWRKWKFVNFLFNQKLCCFGFTDFVFVFVFPTVKVVAVTNISLNFSRDEKELVIVHYIFDRNHCGKGDPTRMEFCTLECQRQRTALLELSLPLLTD